MARLPRLSEAVSLCVQRQQNSFGCIALYGVFSYETSETTGGVNQHHRLLSFLFGWRKQSPSRPTSEAKSWKDLIWN